MMDEENEIQQLINMINSNQRLYLKIEQDEDGFWDWSYLSGLTGENETGFLHDNPRDAIYSLLEWLTLSLREYDDLIFNAVTRTEKGLSNARLNDTFPQPKLDE